MPGKQHYFGMLEVNNKYFLIAHKDNSLFTKNTEAEALNAFTLNYDTRHLLERKMSTSAILNDIQFNPRIIGMTLEEITSKLLDLKKGVKVWTLRGISGSYTGLECNGPSNIKEIYENGRGPKIISESVKQQLR